MKFILSFYLNFFFTFHNLWTPCHAKFKLNCFC
jgi:hypothetical protein